MRNPWRGVLTLIFCLGVQSNKETTKSSRKEEIALQATAWEQLTNYYGSTFTRYMHYIQLEEREN
jgi:hypothetical protein